jgi:ribose-phosphate pyrophosphokinase
MNKLTMTVWNGDFETESFTFTGGEVQVKLKCVAQKDSLGLAPELPCGDVTVLARIQSSDDLVQLMLACEILGRCRETSLRRLVIPYFPYARQDRVMHGAEAFSLKPIAKLINSLGFEEVVTLDPHSDVTPALIENVKTISQADLTWHHSALRKVAESPQLRLVCPDAGAAKKMIEVAKRINVPIIHASKRRDVATGEIFRTEVHATRDQVEGLDMLIVDDLCDGGKTFVNLAEHLRELGAAKVYLYVTHGLFSRGVGVFKGLIDEIFTTDSFLSPIVTRAEELHFPLHVMRIEEVLK